MASFRPRTTRNMASCCTILRLKTSSSALSSCRDMAAVFIFVVLCVVSSNVSSNVFAQDPSQDPTQSVGRQGVTPSSETAPSPSLGGSPVAQRPINPAPASTPVSSSPPPPETLESDAYALLKIKASLQTSLNVMADWLPGSNPCDWTNVQCSTGTNTRVSHVAMAGRQFTGYLPPEVGLLTELSFFDFSRSTIGGNLPKELGNLRSLTQMYLGENRFEGRIPPELGNLRMVTRLTINNCRLSGAIPPEIGNLTSVQYLDISNNPNIDGTLPPEIGNCLNLTILYLGSASLSGEIPDMFSNLRFLQTLSLQNNNLTGRIPPSLRALAEQGVLRTVNLENNNLDGYLPTALGTLPEVSLSPGNENLCNDEVPARPPCPPGTDMPPRGSRPTLGQVSNSSTNQRTIVASVVSIVVVCTVLGTLAWWYFHGRYKLNFKRFLRGYSSTGRHPHSGHSEARHFKTKELQVITGNWSRVIGRGGFGPVYLGVLSDNTKVAIKKLYAQSSQGAVEFVSEVDLLRRLHHRCLVNLVGWCDEVEKVLIYEYKENGSLSSLLYNKKGADAEAKVHVLTWDTRLQIILDVARGLDYLHHGAVPPVVHRDIKSDNVLVDHEFHASVADFGISKAGTVGEIQATTVVKGTLGYLDPEYQRTHVASLASDVYGFGVLLLEIIAGRRPIDPSRPPDEINLQYWALPKLERQEIQAIVDPRLSDYNLAELHGILEIVKDCLQERKFRPTMHEVLHRLEELSEKGLKTSLNVMDGKARGQEANEVSLFETQNASSDDLRTTEEHEKRPRRPAADGLRLANEEMDAETDFNITVADRGTFDTAVSPR